MRGECSAVPLGRDINNALNNIATDMTTMPPTADMNQETGAVGGGQCRPPSPGTLWYAQRLQALAELVNLPLSDWSPLTAVLRLTLQLAFAAGAILGSLLLFFYFLADNVYALVCLFAWSLLLDRLFMRALAEDSLLPFLCLTTGLLILRLVLFLA